MKQYKWDVFSKQVPKTVFRSFLKWLSHFNVSTKIKIILYPVYFAHGAISRVEIKASVNFAKLIHIYSGLIHSFLSQKSNEFRGNLVWLLLFGLQAGEQNPMWALRQLLLGVN